MSLSTNPKEVIPEAVDATVQMLQAASKNSSIKRFVLTSSSWAVSVSSRDMKPIAIDVGKPPGDLITVF